MKKNSKIYVAGHDGMVGTQLMSKLKKTGYKNLIYKNEKQLDLTKQTGVNDFFKKSTPEYVFLLAAKLGGIADKIKYPAEYLYENLMIQNNVIMASHIYGVKKLLFVGSASAYPANCEQPMKEEFLMMGPLSKTEESYGLAKISGIKLCEKISEEYNKKFITCMPTNIYGAGCNFDNPETLQVIPSLIYKMHKAKTEQLDSVDIWGSGKAIRDFVYVDDVAAAIIFLMKYYESTEPLNISNTQTMSISDLAKTIKKIVGFEGCLKFDTSKPEGIPIRTLDSSKLASAGFSCEVDIELGVKKTYEYYLNYLKKKHV